jgi:hypothetical protein
MADKNDQKGNPIVAFALILLFLAAVFLLMPGMAIIALVADVLSLGLDPVQMWAFSLVVSLFIFIALRILLRDTERAGRSYLITCGAVALFFVLFLLGFRAPFSARWVAMFLPPDAPATTTPQTADTPPPDADATPQVRRAVAVSSTPAPSKPFIPSLPEAAESFYRVIGVSRGDTLNVRRGPGTDNPVTAKLPNGAEGIRLIGGPVMNGTTEWVEIAFRGDSGWVSRQHLQPE